MITDSTKSITDYTKTISSAGIIDGFGKGLDQLNTKIPLTKLSQADITAMICKMPFSKGC